MSTEEPAEACNRCGRYRGRDASAIEALAWVAERADGRTSWLCPQCAREHVRDIEGKLPSEYW